MSDSNAYTPEKEQEFALARDFNALISDTIQPIETIKSKVIESMGFYKNRIEQKNLEVSNEYIHKFCSSAYRNSKKAGIDVTAKEFSDIIVQSFEDSVNKSNSQAQFKKNLQRNFFSNLRSLAQEQKIENELEKKDPRQRKKEKEKWKNSEFNRLEDLSRRNNTTLMELEKEKRAEKAFLKNSLISTGVLVGAILGINMISHYMHNRAQKKHLDRIQEARAAMADDNEPAR